MNVRAIYDEVIAAGGRLWIESGRLKVGAPAPLPDPLIDRIRAAKPALVDLLNTEVRRCQVLDMLAKNPRLRLAVITSDEPDAVIVTVGRRDARGHGYTVDLAVARDRYDGVALLQLIEKYSGRPWPEKEGNA